MDGYYTHLAHKIESANQYQYLFTQLDTLNELFINDYRTMYGCAIPKDKMPVLKTPADYQKANMFNDVKVIRGNWKFQDNNAVPKRGKNIGNYRRYYDKGGSVEGMNRMREYDTLKVTKRMPYFDLNNDIFDPTPDQRYHVPTGI